MKDNNLDDCTHVSKEGFSKIQKKYGINRKINASNKDIVNYYKDKDDLLIKTARNNYLQGKKDAKKELIKILDKWYSKWKKDKIQEFWRDDLEEIKQRIKEE